MSKNMSDHVKAFGSHVAVLIRSMIESSVKLNSPMMMVEALLVSCLGLLVYCVSIAVLSVAVYC